MKKINFFTVGEEVELALFKGQVSPPDGIFENDRHFFAEAARSKAVNLTSEPSIFGSLGPGEKVGFIEKTSNGSYAIRP